MSQANSIQSTVKASMKRSKPSGVLGDSEPEKKRPAATASTPAHLEEEKMSSHTSMGSMEGCSNTLDSSTFWEPLYISPSDWVKIDRAEDQAKKQHSDSSLPIPTYKLSREETRLIDERTFLLTKSGSKFVSIGIDPTSFNEPMLRILHRVCTGGVSFNIRELEELLASQQQILDGIVDTAKMDDEDKYEILAKLISYDVLLLPNRTVKFRHTSKPQSSYDHVCMVDDTLKLFMCMGTQFLGKMLELRERRNKYPRLDLFTSDLACRVIQDSLDSLNDICARAVIKENYNDLFTTHELYSKFYYHIQKDVQRKVQHMRDYNNYNFY